MNARQAGARVRVLALGAGGCWRKCDGGCEPLRLVPSAIPAGVRGDGSPIRRDAEMPGQMERPPNIGPPGWPTTRWRPCSATLLGHPFAHLLAPLLAIDDVRTGGINVEIAVVQAVLHRHDGLAIKRGAVPGDTDFRIYSGGQCEVH